MPDRFLAVTFTSLILGSLGAAPTLAASDPATAGSDVAAVPWCEEVPELRAPDDWYRDSPIYVANEQPTDKVRRWARSQAGYQDIWIDRERNGWLTLVFTGDAEAVQPRLERRFPDGGVVAVGVDTPRRDLSRLQRRVAEDKALLDILGDAWSMSRSTTRWVVEVDVGVLADEKIEALAERYAGEPICVTGVDPATRPAPGPQPLVGDGWRLLADERGAGPGWRTGIAFDDASLAALWAEAGLTDEPPSVDFATEVVIWFGAVYGSSCPDLRLDDVVVDPVRAIVHAEIVLPGDQLICTSDANPYAYVVAVERDRLPDGPFAIQLDAADLPSGVRESRTIVEVDLSTPGSVAAPGEVHPDTSAPEPDVLGSGAIVEPGVEMPYRLDTRCGIGWLGEVNDVAWQAETGGDVPAAWAEATDPDGTLVVGIEMRTRPEPRITATAAGESLTYVPSPESAPPCD